MPDDPIIGTIDDQGRIIEGVLHVDDAFYKAWRDELTDTYRQPIIHRYD